MQIRIVAAGKPALQYAKLGIADYQKRLSHGGNFDWIIVKAGSREDVSRRLLAKSEGSYRIAMDERGEVLTTRQFASKMQALEMRGDVKSVSFIIGAAEGHTEELRDQCDAILALSTFTLQHELALLVLCEQLYRISSLRSGSPYHRD